MWPSFPSCSLGYLLLVHWLPLLVPACSLTLWNKFHNPVTLMGSVPDTGCSFYPVMSHAAVAWGQLPVCPSVWHDSWCAEFLPCQGFAQILIGDGIQPECRPNACVSVSCAPPQKSVHVELNLGADVSADIKPCCRMMEENASPLTSSQQKYPGVTWGAACLGVSTTWWRPMKRLLFLGCITEPRLTQSSAYMTVWHLLLRL